MARDNYLQIGAYSSVSLFNQHDLNLLQQVLSRVFPSWSRNAILVEDEEDTDSGLKFDVDKDGFLFSVLADEAERNRRFRKEIYDNRARNMRADSGRSPIPPYDSEDWDGRCIITDEKPQMMLSLSYCTKPRRLDDNYLAIQCYDCNIEAIKSQVALQSAFLEIVRSLSIEWGFLHAHEEFTARNCNHRGDVIRPHLNEGLPGLYWINFFGPLYCQAIGYDKLASAPGAWIKPLKNGVAIAIGGAPDEWTTSEYALRRAAVEHHLGTQWFYSKSP